MRVDGKFSLKLTTNQCTNRLLSALKCIVSIRIGARFLRELKLKLPKVSNGIQRFELSRINIE